MVAAAQKSGEELAAERDAAARGAEPGAGGPRIGTGGGWQAAARERHSRPTKIAPKASSTYLHLEHLECSR